MVGLDAELHRRGRWVRLGKGDGGVDDSASKIISSDRFSSFVCVTEKGGVEISLGFLKEYWGLIWTEAGQVPLPLRATSTPPARK